jgi:hypothetical protein
MPIVSKLATTIMHFVEHQANVLFVLHFTEVLDPTIMTAAYLDNINVFHMTTHSSSESTSYESDFGDTQPLYKLKLGNLFYIIYIINVTAL